MRRLVAVLCVLMLGVITMVAWQDITAAEHEVLAINRAIGAISVIWDYPSSDINVSSEFFIEIQGSDASVNISTEADVLFTRDGVPFATETVHWVIHVHEVVDCTSPGLPCGALNIGTVEDVLFCSVDGLRCESAPIVGSVMAPQLQDGDVITVTIRPFGDGAPDANPDDNVASYVVDGPISVENKAWGKVKALYR